MTGPTPNRRAGLPWSHEDDAEMRHLTARGLSLVQVATALERRPAELATRLGLPVPDSCLKGVAG